MPSESPSSPSFERTVARGALMNVLGLAGKSVQLLIVLLVTWLFGPELMGVYLLSVFLLEIASTAVGAAWTDATTIYASHDAEAASQDAAARKRLDQVLGNALAFAGGFAILVAVLTQVGAAPLVRSVFPEYGSLLPGLYFVAWSLFPAAIADVAIAALKAYLRMEWDAVVNGFVRPLGMLLSVGVAYLTSSGLTGILVGHALVQLVAAAVALRALRRFLRLGPMFAAALRPRLHRPMLSFAIPQSLNMLFNRYITRLDALMLAGMGTGPLLIAWYGTASLLISQLRQIRMVFSTAVSPVAARQFARGEKRDLTHSLGKLSRWTTTLIAPAVMALLILRDDVLGLIDPAYRGDSRFVAVLLIAPLVDCAYGLAGNFIVYAGRTRWNLVNSLGVGVVNTGLNYLLISPFGLLGAAIATAIAIASIAALQLAEIRWLEDVKLEWSAVWQPHAGLFVFSLVLFALWDPADLGTFPLRLLLATAVVVGFFVAMLLFGHPEVRWIVRRRLERARLG